jgi:hypothetical protein
MTAMHTPNIGDPVRVSMYNFITGTVSDWEGTVTGRVSDSTLVITDAEEGHEYIIPVRHIHVQASPAIAGA